MKLTKLKALGVASLVVAALACAAMPAHARVAGAGASVTHSPSGRFVAGAGTYVVHPHANLGNQTITFACTAAAGPDASQTRIAPPWEGGCALYKGETVLAQAGGAVLPGPAQVTTASPAVSINMSGDFKVCWRVSATFVTNGGTELTNAGCTAVHL